MTHEIKVVVFVSLIIRLLYDRDFLKKSHIL